MAINYVIREATRAEVEIAVSWAATEGWNPGLHDAAPFFATDPHGFLIGMLDGEPVATISVVSYNNRFGFLGFYIVKPGHRGKGLGIAIWNEAMRRMSGHVVGLDGVLARVLDYEKSGFKLAYRNHRYQGISGNLQDTFEEPLGFVTVPLANIHRSDLLAFDTLHFPETRSAFLHSWITAPGSIGLGATRHGKIIGYGVIRPCRSGWKIGPLFAHDTKIADTLFTRLVRRVPEDQPIYLDVPEVNPEAVALCARHGMTEVFATARMYRGPAPSLPLQQIFGVTTFELG